jgi:hypothetical protein
MRIKHLITIGAISLFISLAAGCSKSSSPSQATTPTTPAEIAAFMTNSLDILQARCQANQTNIDQALAMLDQLQKTYTTNDQPYLDEQRKAEQMIAFQKLLKTKIEADKLGAQFPAQGTH